MKITKTCLSAIISGVLIFSPMAYADKWSDQFPHIKATGDIPGDCSYEKISKKNYKGKTLKINTHAVPVIGQPTALHAEQFAKLTLADVNRVIKENLQTDDIHYVFISGDGEDMKKRLLSEQTSSLKYNSEKPAELLATDKIIESYKLTLPTKNVEVIAVDSVFE